MDLAPTGHRRPIDDPSPSHRGAADAGRTRLTRRWGTATGRERIFERRRPGRGRSNLAPLPGGASVFAVNLPLLNALRLIGLVEGVSTLVLFGVAMPLKYVYGLPVAVTIAGSIHGLLFVALVAANAVAVARVPIGTRLAAAGVVAAVVPFGPFVVERWLGRLAREGARGAGEDAGSGERQPA